MRIALRLAARCPECGARPSIRVYVEQADKFDADLPSELVLSVQCQRKSCGEIYDITARAFQAAS